VDKYTNLQHCNCKLVSRERLAISHVENVVDEMVLCVFDSLRLRH